MDRNNRPLSREKHVTGGSAHVGRRASGGSIPGGGPRHSGGPISGGGGGPKRSGGGGGMSPLSLIIGLAVLLLGGGAGATSFLGGGSGSVSNYTGQYYESGTDVSQWGATGNTTLSGGTLDNSVSEKARDKRTVIKGNGSDRVTLMVYMCGTDLESNGGYASRDLAEMANANLSENVNIIVFTGGTKNWKTQGLSGKKNQILQVKKGQLVPLAESKSLSPMTSPDTLAGFIQWGKKNFPADRYDLILWDHGGGSISGYGYDEVYASNGSMTLDKLGTALKDGGCTFDFIGFDACLMATLETALVAEPYADYLIASEETEPGLGWYYTNWLSELSANTSIPTTELGKIIIDDFTSACNKQTPRQQTTLSLTDLAELAGTLPESFKDFSESTTKLIKNDNYKIVSNARSGAKEFGASSHIDQVDLSDLALRMNTEEGKDLADVVKSAVKYNLTSSNVQNAYGLAIYFPYGNKRYVSRMTDTYDKIGLDPAYTNCVRSFASIETAGQSVYGGNSGQMSSLFGSLLSEGNGYASSSTALGNAAIESVLESLLTGSNRSLADVGLTADETDFLDEETLSTAKSYLEKHQLDQEHLQWKEKDGKDVLVLSEDEWDIVQNVELNVFVDDGAGYLDLGLDNVFSFDDDGNLIGEYDGTWLAINGNIVSYTMKSAEGSKEDYKITGYVPAKLNSQRVNLLLSFTDECPEGEVLGAQIVYDTETETETQARGLLEIQDGDVIDFLCDYYDYDRNYQDSYEIGDPMTVNGALAVSNIRMDNENYVAAYRLTDIYQNHYWTPSIR